MYILEVNELLNHLPWISLIVSRALSFKDFELVPNYYMCTFYKLGRYSLWGVRAVCFGSDQ